MEVKVKPLSFEQHGKLKVAKGPHLAAIENANNVDIAVHEFASAACEAPVIFIKNADSGQFRAVAVTGLKPNENLFFKNGQWQASFIPHALGNTPFYLGQNENSTELADAILLVDEHSNAIGNEGVALFNEDGSYSDYVEATKTSLQDFVRFQQVTKHFVDYLVEHELLVSRAFDLDVSGEKITLHGIYLVDQEKLDSLSDEQFLTLRKRGYLTLIYSHLTSIHQFSNLIKQRHKLLG